MAKGNQQQRRDDPKPAPAPQRREEPKAAPMPISQAIRQAGSGGITKQELNTIVKDSGKSAADVIQKLDAINQNLKEKDKTGINLGGAASNMLIRQASKQSPNAFLDAVMGPAMGTGRIGTELQSRATEFGTTGSMGSLIPRGMSAMPSGRLTISGVGNQYELPKTTIKNPIGGEGYKPSMAKPGTEVVEPTVGEVAPTEITPTATQALSIPGISTNVTNWATGIRGKKSSRRQANRSAQGLGSQTVRTPTGGFRGGV